jgi:hypothetical protein
MGSMDSVKISNPFAHFIAHPLAALTCLALFVSGCGKSEAPAPSVPAPAPPPQSVESSILAPTAPPREISATPSPAEAVVPGAALPAATTEMMLQFEARFGRPPSNYNELRRLEQPAPPKPAPRK